MLKSFGRLRNARLLLTFVSCLAFDVSPLFAQIDHGPDGSGWTSEREAVALGKNINAAIRACDRQAVEPTSEARASQKTLEEQRIHFSDTAPGYISQLGGGKFGPARFHRWLDPHAEVWLVAYTMTPACRVIVLNSAFAQASRPELERLITSDSFWKKDGANSFVTASDWSTVFRGSLRAETKTEALLKLQGVGVGNSDGSGIQLTALVALARN
jgi:hypothetical protein